MATPALVTPAIVATAGAIPSAQVHYVDWGAILIGTVVILRFRS